MEQTSNVIYQTQFCPHILNHFNNTSLNSLYDYIDLPNKKADSSSPGSSKRIPFRSLSLLSSPLSTVKYYGYNQAHNLLNDYLLSNLSLNWIVINNTQNLPFPSINREGCIFTIAFDEEGTLMASSNHNHNHHIEIWDLQKKKLKKVITEHKEIVTGIDFFKKRSDMFLSCSLDKTIKLWKNYTNIHTFIEHSDWVRCIAINHDNTQFLSGCVSSVVKLWDVTSQRVIASITNQNPDPDSLSTVNSLSFFKTNPNIFLSGFRSGEIKFYDTRIPVTSKTVGISKAFKAHKNKLNSVKLNSAENFVLSSGRDSLLRLWDMRMLPQSVDDAELNRKYCVNEYSGHKCAGYNIDSNFFAKEQYIITGSEDSNIYIYDAVSAKIAHKIPTHQKCINLLRPIPRTFASFACTGLEDISIFIWDAMKNTNKCIERRYYEKKNMKNEGDSNEEDELDKFEEKENAQVIYAKMVEDIMAECGDLILKIFHSHNLTYSSGINFDNLMEIIQRSNDQESLKILRMINDKFMKRLMDNFINEMRPKDNFISEMRPKSKKPIDKKSQQEDVTKLNIVKCLRCAKASVPVIENEIEEDTAMLTFPNKSNAFAEKESLEEMSNDVKEEKKIYLENNNSVVMKSIISNSTIPFKDNTYLLNKFL